MTNEEMLNAVLTVIREENTKLRTIVREETNAAVYASEQRIIAYVEQSEQHLSKRMDTLEQHFGVFEQRFDTLEQRIDELERHMIDRFERIEQAQRDMRLEIAMIKGDISALTSIMNDASFVINDLLQSQQAVEARVEEHIKTVSESLKQMGEYFASSIRDMKEVMQEIDRRITRHMHTRLNDAHPGAA